MGTIDTLLRIKADASQAVRGLAPLQASLEETAKDAQGTEKALSGLDGTHKISVNDQAVDTARREIERLRGSIREGFALTPDFDDRDAQRRIVQLKRSIKSLEDTEAVVEARVEVDTTDLSRLQTGLDSFAGTTVGGMIPGLSRLSGALGGVGVAAGAAAGGAAAAVVGIGAVGVASGLAAAEIETLTVQLDALTEGQGTETLKFLQTWAKETPFELEQATEATKRLVAAGVGLQTIPDYLDDIGGVASATGVPLDQIATVFAQMEGKGKATFEEMQQLAEAGVPVWQVMAEALGMTVAEVQKLATEGKLTADAITLLRQSLGKKYPDAMSNQAETLDGKLSSLKDTFTQTWQELGTVFLPALKDGGDGLQTFGDIISDVTRLWTHYVDTLKQTPLDEVLDFSVKATLGPLKLIGKGVDDLADKYTGVDDDVVKLGDSTEEAMATAESAVAQAASEFKELQKAAEDAVEATLEAFANIGGSIRTKIDFIIGVDDLKESIAKTIDGVNAEGTDNDIPPVQLPADLTVRGVAGLTDPQQGLLGDISSFVSMQLEEGARRAEMVPGFDEDAWYAQVRQSTRGLLIDAGIDSDQVNRVLTNIFGLPRSVPVTADVSAARADLNQLSGTSVSIVPYVDQAAAEQAGILNSLIFGPGGGPGVPAPITPTVDPVAAGTAAGAVNTVAMPAGAPRTAGIRPVIDPIMLSIAQGTLAALTAPATKVINVVVNDPTGAGGGSTTPSSTGGGTPRLAPRQTPVQVLLDGQEISTHLELQVARVSATGARRTA